MMKYTIICKRWDVILVPFPFTDLTTIKKRPSLVISPDSFNFNEDIVIAFITSNIPSQMRAGDYKIKDLQITGLPKPSIIRMKFATINKTIIVKKLGNLSEKDSLNFQKMLIDFYS